MRVEIEYAQVEFFLTPSQVGALVGLTPASIVREAELGRLPGVRTPRGRMFSRAAVEQWRVEREARKACKSRWHSREVDFEAEGGEG